jgi:predicted transcriptional regulator
LTNHKQERAQKIIDATMHLTLRPQREDRAKVIAAAIRAMADSFLYDDNGIVWFTAYDFYEIAKDLEAL